MPDQPAPHRHKVLIVDDDPGMVHLLARTLLNIAQLHFAVRGDDALQKAAQHRPDLLLIDAELPDVDGYEVIRRLRERPETASLPFVMVTSHNTPSYRQRALDLGASDFFIKPIDREVVRRRVEQILLGEEMEIIELDTRPMAPAVAVPVPAAVPVVAAPVAAPVAEPATDMAAVADIDVHALTSELFERLSAILSQTEALRASNRAATTQADLFPIQRIEEECAEAIQLLVSLSG